MMHLLDLDDSKKFKKTIVTAYTAAIGATWDGRKYENVELTARKYHSFNTLKGRERQILSHVVTQLYFALKPYECEVNGNLIEVQAMHLRCNEKSNLFIVANPWSNTKNFISVINESNFENLLTYFYMPKGKEEGEGKIRSRRFGLKLARRAFNEDYSFKGAGDTNTIKTILACKKIKLLKLDYGETRTELTEKKSNSYK